MYWAAIEAGIHDQVDDEALGRVTYWPDTDSDHSYVITGVDDEAGDDVLPRMTAVFQNYPNPFNPRTEIRFDLKAPAPVSLQVYNVAGVRVATLVNEIMASGQHRVEWFGTDDQGRALASGVYLYRFQADDVTEVRRMMLIR